MNSFCFLFDYYIMGSCELCMMIFMGKYENMGVEREYIKDIWNTINCRVFREFQ